MVQADANYEEVHMDLSEDSQGSSGSSRSTPDRRGMRQRRDQHPTNSSRRDIDTKYRNRGGGGDDRRDDRRDPKDDRKDPKDDRRDSKDDRRDSKDNRRDSKDDRRDSRDDRRESKDDKRSDAKDRYRSRDDRFKDRYRDDRNSRDGRDGRDARYAERRSSRRSSSRERRSRSPRRPEHRNRRSNSRDRDGRPSYGRKYDRYQAKGAFEKQEVQKPAVVEAQNPKQDSDGNRFFMPGITGRFRDQIERRKLLWQKKDKDVEKQEAAAPSTSGTGKVWQTTTFAQDTDGKVASKFKRLMGIREPGGDGQKPGGTDILKKQEEMFSSMEQQYEVARTATHTMRGVGLGFGSFQR